MATLTRITDHTHDWDLDRHGIIIGGGDHDNGSQLLADLLTRARQAGYTTYYTGPAFTGLARPGAFAADRAAENGDMTHLVKHHIESGAAPAVLGVDIAHTQPADLYEQVRAATNITLIYTSPDLSLDPGALAGGNYQMCVASQTADPAPQELPPAPAPQKASFDLTIPHRPEPHHSAGTGQTMPGSLSLAYGTHSDGTRAWWPLSDPQGRALHGSITGSINTGKTNLLRVLAQQALAQGIQVWSLSSGNDPLPGRDCLSTTHLTARIEDYTGTTPVLAVSDGEIINPDPPHPLVSTIHHRMNNDPAAWKAPTPDVQAKMSLHSGNQTGRMCQDPGSALVHAGPGQDEHHVRVDHIPGHEGGFQAYRRQKKEHEELLRQYLTRRAQGLDAGPHPGSPRWPEHSSNSIKAHIYSGGMQDRSQVSDALLDLAEHYQAEQVPDTAGAVELTRTLAHAYRGNAYGQIGQRLVQELSSTRRLRPHMDLIDELHATARSQHSNQTADQTIGVLMHLPKYERPTLKALKGW